MNLEDDTFNRRKFLVAASMFGTVAMIGGPAHSSASVEERLHSRDWEWLVGNWDVDHRRLRGRLSGSTQWEEFKGKSVLWLTMGGLGTIDDNVLDLPGGIYRAITIRAFDSASGKWLIWWLDGRNPAKIDPPVLGVFNDDAGTFIGRDTWEGKPVIVRFRWLDVHSVRPHWEQAFSPDDGATWEVNWVNFFTRTSPRPSPLPLIENRRHDWDFLVGRWHVEHRRLEQRLAESDDWRTFHGSLVNWPVLGGQGNVGDNVMQFPSGPYKGVSIRAFDPEENEWLSWWLDGRNPAVIGTPLRGGFTNGVGIFFGEEIVDGQTVKTRVVWSDITPTSARWEQASSLDGRTWEVNWVSTFTKEA